MDTFITVLTVQYPQQLWIIKGRLESEGIQCFVKDELTVQSYNLYSNAVGGVKLQVLQEDVEQAREILMELGYIKGEPVTENIFTTVNSKTGKLPFFKGIGIGWRIIILITLFIAFLTTILYFILKPSMSAVLTEHSWCVDRIEHNGGIIGPKTVGSFQVTMLDVNGNADCVEQIILEKNGRLRLPGVNTWSIDGYWKINDKDKIEIKADTLGNIFNAAYDVKLDGNLLILKSSVTVFYAHRDDFRFSNPLDGLIRKR